MKLSDIKTVEAGPDSPIFKGGLRMNAVQQPAKSTGEPQKCLAGATQAISKVFLIFLIFNMFYPSTSFSKPNPFDDYARTAGGYLFTCFYLEKLSSKRCPALSSVTYDECFTSVIQLIPVEYRGQFKDQFKSSEKEILNSYRPLYEKSYSDALVKYNNDQSKVCIATGSSFESMNNLYYGTLEILSKYLR